jgi:hypothetical protein
VPSKRTNKLFTHAHHSDLSVAAALFANGTYFVDTPRSSVGIGGEGLRAGQPGSHSRQEQEIFLLSTANIPAPGPTQPPVQWIPGSVSVWVKRPGMKLAEHSPLSGAEVKNGGAIPTLPYIFSWFGACLIKHRNNFTKITDRPVLSKLCHLGGLHWQDIRRRCDVNEKLSVPKLTKTTQLWGGRLEAIYRISQHDGGLGSHWLATL